MKRSTFCAAALLLAGCSAERGPPANQAAAAAAEHDRDVEVPPSESAPEDAADAGTPADAHLGRWVGVEGMYLVVAKGAAPGRYRLDMQWDLDHKGSFAGRAEGDAIAFDRAGVHERLRPTDGAATGLKYLADKRDCLTVKPGEGYCRG